MTIIDELLILLDDLEQASAESIPTYFENPNLQIIFSSLGRLVNRGWVIKKTKRSEVTYSISTHGINELNSTLDCIKSDSPPTWNKQWHLIIFDIPETKRKLRDSLRVQLKDLGYGMLTSSVWVSTWDRSEAIKRYAKRNNLNDNIFSLTTMPATDSYQATLFAHRCWDWAKIEKAYKDFIATASNELKQLAANGDPAKTRFHAKRLVFQYAEVMKIDPQLPVEISPNATLARRARELYIKIRPYCLQSE